jgi:hypothetical protein
MSPSRRYNVKATITINGQSTDVDAEKLLRYLYSAHNSMGEALRGYNENTTISAMMTGKRWDAEMVAKEFDRHKEITLRDLKRMEDLNTLMVTLERSIRRGK